MRPTKPRGLDREQSVRWYASSAKPRAAPRWLAKRLGPCRRSYLKPDREGYVRVTLRNPGSGKWEAVWLHREIMLQRHPGSESKEARHLCGRPWCIADKHLVPGTSRDNSADAIEHGTQVRGERQGSAKLTEREVRRLRRLRKLGLTWSELGAMVPRVHQATVRLAVLGETWAHVPA